MAEARGAAGLSVLPAGASAEELVGAIEAHHRQLAAQWATIQGGVVEDHPELLRTAVGLPVTYTNQINAARLAPLAADAAIAETEAFLDRHGVPGMWVVGPLSRPEDLDARLVRRGWVHDEDLPWMAAPIGDVLDAVSPRPAGLSVEVVEDDDAQDRWLGVMSAGFGMDERGRAAMSRLRVSQKGSFCNWDSPRAHCRSVRR